MTEFKSGILKACHENLLEQFPIESRHDYLEKFGQYYSSEIDFIKQDFIEFSSIDHKQHPLYEHAVILTAYGKVKTTVNLTFPTKGDAIWWKLAQ